MARIKRKIGKINRTLLLFLSCLSLASCNSKEPLWIYTSLYKDLVNEIRPLVEKDFPGVEIRWHYGGSEKVAETVKAELEAGVRKADLLLIADPFLYLELKEKGHLQAYASPAHKDLPAEYLDSDNYFAAARLMAMTLGYNSKVLSSSQVPKSWKDLLGAQWKKKLSMGNPLHAGSTFAAVSALAHRYGWDYFQGLKANELISHGDNSSVVTRVENGSQPLGIVLLENILTAQNQGSPIRALYPEDGVILIPGYLAIMKGARRKTAQKLYDWFYSDVAQKTFVRWGMYSPLSTTSAPYTALPLNEIKRHAILMTPRYLGELGKSRQRTDSRFRELFLAL